MHAAPYHFWKKMFNLTISIRNSIQKTDVRPLKIAVIQFK